MDICVFGSVCLAIQKSVKDTFRKGANRNVKKSAFGQSLLWRVTKGSGDNMQIVICVCSGDVGQIVEARL